MDVVVLTVVLAGVAPFVALAWLLVRGSRGGKVRSLGNRKDSGRAIDTHAVQERTEAAETAQKHLEHRRQNTGWVSTLFGGGRDD